MVLSSPQVVGCSSDSHLRLAFLGRKSPIEAYCHGFWLFSSTQMKQTATQGATLILEPALLIPCSCVFQRSTSIAVFTIWSCVFATPGEGKGMRCDSEIPCWLYVCLSWILFGIIHLVSEVSLTFWLPRTPRKKIYLIWAAGTVESTPVTVSLFALPRVEKEHKVISSDLSTSKKSTSSASEHGLTGTCIC